MSGINRNDGSEIATPWEHCLQSIIDILTTPVGTRVMRRGYGSAVPELIDRPGERDVVLEVTMAMGDAIAKWEPRFRFWGLGITGVEGLMTAGEFQIDVVGDFYPRGHLGDFSVVESDRGLRVPLRRASFVPLPVGT